MKGGDPGIEDCPCINSGCRVSSLTSHLPSPAPSSPHPSYLEPLMSIEACSTRSVTHSLSGPQSLEKGTWRREKGLRIDRRLRGKEWNGEGR